MSAVHAEPIEVVETPFARARAHAVTVEGLVTSDEMIRKPHSDLEAMLDGQEVPDPLPATKPRLKIDQLGSISLTFDAVEKERAPKPVFSRCCAFPRKSRSA